MSKGAKRRTKRERLGERKIYRWEDWQRIFPGETANAAKLARVRPKIEEKILTQPEAQIIGRLREEKFIEALGHLKEKGEIRDYLSPGKLSYTDLIEGVDFIFVYVDRGYKVCRCSVTGPEWIGKHQARHPEISIIPVGLNESRESIEEKILALKNSNRNSHLHR